MPTPHQKVEAALTSFALTLPETSAGPAWPGARGLYVRKKMFFVFGAKGEAANALTTICKLPVSAEMVQHLPFVRESKGWYKQHNWVIAHFGPADAIAAELPTLKAWLLQSYAAVAPKKLAREAAAAHAPPRAPSPASRPQEPGPWADAAPPAKPRRRG